MDFDIQSLTLTQIVLVLFAITFLDWISGIAGAIMAHEFTLDKIADFLVTHVLWRVIPLCFMAALGMGVPALKLPAITPLWALFLVGAVSYIAETIASIAENLKIRPTS